MLDKLAKIEKKLKNFILKKEAQKLAAALPPSMKDKSHAAKMKYLQEHSPQHHFNPGHGVPRINHEAKDYHLNKSLEHHHKSKRKGDQHSLASEYHAAAADHHYIPAGTKDIDKHKKDTVNKMVDAIGKMKSKKIDTHKIIGKPSTPSFPYDK